MTLKKPKKKAVKKAVKKKSPSQGTKKTSFSIPRENDVKMTEMVDLAAEMFVHTLEASSRIPDRMKSRLLKAIKEAAKEALS
ncbi:hypothetical protein LEP1GSC058_3194 [Leptospira fainei serovar Hurstbridge str. BUT 6]|uniref:Uncharacterized protein n=1 Tax=Leptospira fainei serovar Hurstbridge str. BUT 6 TaxID=1193011 RepID=S3VZ65_9LEPT|nr:hypothetical protein [Leptospira fainei]EPG73377.1 hypothetical protein LEP1GSC058_3194 [Leptospira fainei serovar Hurstbridge str. BUT 6]